MKIEMLNRRRGLSYDSTIALRRATAHLRFDLLEKSQEAKGGFGPWLKNVSPTWQWELPHLRFLRYYLDQVTRGTLKNLLVTMPPRHGKTEQGSIRYPGYRLELDPTMRIMLVSHTQKFANRISRNVRKIVENRVEMNPGKRAANEWETRAGGGFNAFGALGVGGGLGFHLIVIDDIIKGSKQAHSPTYRENLVESFHRDIKTRREPGGAMIMTLTRWHQQDIAGSILDSDEAKDWVVIKLPALAESDDPLGRPEGMALWPERWNAPYLRLLQKADPRGFEALYQQNPTPPGGDMFLGDWFGPDSMVDALPADCRYVRYWDKAGTEKTENAATAGVLMAKAPNGVYYIVDVVRGHWRAGVRESLIRRIAEIDGPNVEVFVEQEPGSGGKEQAQATIINLAGFRIKADRVTGDKVTRAHPLAAQCSVGNVRIVRDSPVRRWNAGFLKELLVFPQGAHKDQVDAAAGAFNKLALVPTPGEMMVSGPRLGIEHQIDEMYHLDPAMHAMHEPGLIWTPGYEPVWSGY
jgi:predicted phage terminase large subunit-like protein